MAQPFDGPTAERGRGLLHRKARGAACREIEQLLAHAGRVTDVAAEQIDAAAARNGLDLHRHLGATCRDLYRRYLAHCLLDQRLSDAELADLAHLRAVLGVGEADAADVHEEVAGTVYGSAIDEVLADQRLEPDEEHFLERLRADLRLDAGVAAKALVDGRARARQRFIQSVVSHDDVLVASRDARIEIEGRSETSMEDAVDAAVAEACAALPNLGEVEVTRIRAELEDGQVACWCVSLKASLRDAH